MTINGKIVLPPCKRRLFSSGSVPLSTAVGTPSLRSDSATPSVDLKTQFKNSISCDPLYSSNINPSSRLPNPASTPSSPSPFPPPTPPPSTLVPEIRRAPVSSSAPPPPPGLPAPPTPRDLVLTSPTMPHGTVFSNPASVSSPGPPPPPGLPAPPTPSVLGLTSPAVSHGSVFSTSASVSSLAPPPPPRLPAPAMPPGTVFTSPAVPPGTVITSPASVSSQAPPPPPGLPAPATFGLTPPVIPPGTVFTSMASVSSQAPPPPGLPAPATLPQTQCPNLMLEQPANFVVHGNHSVPSLVGLGPVKGIFNTLEANLIVFEADNDKLQNRVSEFLFGPLRGTYIAAFYGVQIYFDGDTQKWYKIYGFEGSNQYLHGLDCFSNAFGLVQSVIRKSLKAISFVHSINYVADNLASEYAFLFCQAGRTVTIKLYPYYCISRSSGYVLDTRTNQYDVANFAVMLGHLFFGYNVSISDALKYDSATNFPPIFFVPEFPSKKKRAYSLDVVHFLKKAVGPAFGGCLPDELLNETVIWKPSKRIGFYVAACRSISNLDDTDELFEDLNFEPGFVSTCEEEWRNFSNNVRRDLGAPNYKDPSVDPKYKFAKGSGSYFLRSVRNLVSHRAGDAQAYKEYCSYDIDGDFVKGLDLFLSANLPSYFTFLFDILQKRRKSGFKDALLEPYLNDRYCEALLS